MKHPVLDSQKMPGNLPEKEVCKRGLEWSKIHSKYGKYARLTLGVASLIAASVSCSSVALTCLALRSFLGGFGGYTVATQIYHKKYPSGSTKVSSVIGMVGAAVGAILPLSQLGDIPLEGSYSLPTSQPMPPLYSPLNSETAIQYVQKDHPEEAVSLERCFRRILAHEQGLDPQDMSVLQQLGTPAAEVLRNNASGIETYMRHVGYIGVNEDFESACRTLKIEDIQDILNHYSASRNAIDASGESVAPSEGTDVQSIPIITAGIGAATAAILDKESEKKRYKRQSLRKKSTPLPFSTKEIPITPMKISGTLRNKENSWEFMQELEYTEAGSNCWKNRQAAGTTVIIYHENTKEIHAIWRGKNGGKVHYSKKIDLRNTSKKEATIACIDGLISTRDSWYKEQFAQVHEVEVQQSDLEAILGQASHRIVRGNSIETGGFWFCGGANIAGNTLKLSNLQLPDFSIQNITSGSFELKSGIGGQFFDANKRAALIGQYGLFEANRIIQKVLEQLYTQGKITYTSTIEAFNWHKHPSSSLYHPSGGDTGRFGAQTEFHQSDLPVKFWGILVDCTNNRSVDFLPKHGIFLEDSLYGRKYFLSFWKLKRDIQDPSFHDLEALPLHVS